MGISGRSVSPSIVVKLFMRSVDRIGLRIIQDASELFTEPSCSKKKMDSRWAPTIVINGVITPLNL